MPFVKIGKDKYKSPSGRIFNGAQVRLWYEGGGKFPGQKTKELKTKRIKKLNKALQEAVTTTPTA